MAGVSARTPTDVAQWICRHHADRFSFGCFARDVGDPNKRWGYPNDVLFVSITGQHVVLHGDGVSSRLASFDLNSPTFMVSLMMGALVTLLIVARIPTVRQSSHIVATENDDLGDLYLPNGRMLTSGVSLGNGWTELSGINYVLGESGTGKTTYMRALQNGFRAKCRDSSRSGFLLSTRHVCR